MVYSELLLWHLSRGTVDNHIKSIVRLVTGRRLKPRTQHPNPHKYRATVPTIQMRRSVKCYQFVDRPNQVAIWRVDIWGT
jgi:hypothetical protein